MNTVTSSALKLVVFDLSGTTICDDNAVAKCLYAAAVEHGLNVSLDDFRKTIGTNKIKLYAFMIARNEGHLSIHNRYYLFGIELAGRPGQHLLSALPLRPLLPLMG